MKIEEKIVETKNGKIDYIEVGEGENVLVYFHGWTGNPLLAKKFAKRGYRVIAPYLPSHGDSFEISSDFTFKDMVATFEDFFEKLNLKNVFCVGHSVGGITVYELANSGKKLVKKAAVIDGYNNYRHDNIWHLLPLLWAVIKQDKLIKPFFFPSLKAKKIRSSGLFLNDALLKTFVPSKFNAKSMRIEDYLFIWGNHDPITPEKEWIKQIGIERCNLVEFNGGHCWCTMHLSRVIPLIEKFFKL